MLRPLAFINKVGLVLVLLCACAPFQTQTNTKSCQSKLRHLSQEAYHDLNDLDKRLTALELALIEQNDVRAAFASTYRIVTQKIILAIRENQFESSSYMTRLTLDFANLYRAAFWEHECNPNSTVALAWQFSFNPEADPLSAAILAVNAHINHDLSFALYPLGLTQSHYRDHNKVNLLLASVIDPIQRKLAEYDRRILSIDEGLATLDELVFLDLIIQWREQAWQNAVRLSNAQNSLDEQHNLWLINSYANHTAEHLNAILSLADMFEGQ